MGRSRFIYDERKKLIVSINGAGYMHAALKINENTWLVISDSDMSTIYKPLLLYKDGVLTPVMNNGSMVYTNNYKLHKLKDIKKFLTR